MEKQIESEPNFLAYDAMSGLLSQQTAALQSYKESLAACQRENERLVEGYRFYADRENWRSRLAHLDAGEKAREILKEVTGE